MGTNSRTLMVRGQGVQMRQVTWNTFIDLDWRTVGQPVLFALHNDQVWLWPTPAREAAEDLSACVVMGEEGATGP